MNHLCYLDKCPLLLFGLPIRVVIVVPHYTYNQYKQEAQECLISLRENQTEKNHRVGLARALVAEQNQKVCSSNNSLISVNTTNTLRNHPSLDPSIMGNKGLFKKSSRASVISRDTIVSNIPDDNLSVTSFTNEMKNFNIDAESPQLQQLDDFDVDDYQDQYDLTLELEGSPYLKEGLLKSKIINDDQDNNLEFDRKSTSNESRFLSFFRSSTYTNSSGSNNRASHICSIRGTLCGGFKR